MPDALDFRDPDWVAEQLNIDKNAVYRYLNEGLLPGLQLGRKWLISESSLVEYLKAEEKRQTQARRQFGDGLIEDLESGRLYQRFSERARDVLVTAQKEALNRYVSYIGQEHLLLGIASVEGSAGLAILTSLGVSAEQLRAAVDQVSAQVPRSGPTGGKIALSPRAKRAISLAADEATHLNHSYVGVEHLLIGLLREGEGVGYGVLTSLGVTLDRVRAELKQHLARVSKALTGGQTVSGIASDASNDQPGSTETAA
ncbi:MAG TPA: Clp protease N-terminal domain-containing protein [Dehalococcoidia bacterium]